MKEKKRNNQKYKKINKDMKLSWLETPLSLYFIWQTSNLFFVFSLYLQYSSFLFNSFNVSAPSIKVITQSSMPFCLSEQ